MAFASLGFLVFGNIAIAAASNSAVPGDLLYPVDRAFENVADLIGVDVGGATERLEEAAVLIARGQFDIAIEPIAAAAANLDDETAAAIETLAAHLAQIEPGVSNREDLHNATFSLLATVRGVAESGTADVAAWKQAVANCVQDVANTAKGRSFTPPGQDDTFVPPGQEDGSTPPGQEDKDKDVPPGQEDKDKDVPPGQEDKDKDVPPGQEVAQLPSEDSPPPPGQEDEFVPPGQDDEFTPPGRNRDTPKGGRNHD
ncbi:MAG: hypothetical protein QNL12_00055 [Acidimicrobiia bacterium]|nr:hypothetical protein [Acidimicrobiia bacterium]MDX2465677.1 hypothetical protein [Acidimicrobiia bacterium]